MSLFGGGGAARKQAEAAAAQMQMFQARSEMEFTMNMFNAMTRNCYRKCVPKLRDEPDLNVAEMTCVDRCVSKFMKAHAKVGKEMEKQNAAMAGQQGIPAGQ
jgi:import inner membrane translocase subunit TIM10